MQVLFDLSGPDRDTAPPRAPVPPAASLIVCSTPRSGSGLLCRGLAATGAAGTPLEYFNPVHRERLAARWGCGDGLDAYVASLYRLRTTHAGVFGAKVHWEHLRALTSEAGGDPLEDWFPGAAYVRIRRRDRERQAVSLWCALNDGIWSVAAGEPMPPDRDAVPYSFAGIARCHDELAAGDAAWDAHLAARGIVPAEVALEELVADYAGTIARIAGLLPGPAAPALHLGPPTRRLADTRSEAFARRFREERRGLLSGAWQTSPSGSPRGRSS